MITGVRNEGEHTIELYMVNAKEERVNTVAILKPGDEFNNEELLNNARLRAITLDAQGETTCNLAVTEVNFVDVFDSNDDGDMS